MSPMSGYNLGGSPSTLQDPSKRARKENVLITRRGNQYLYYLFAELPEIYFIPKQEAPTAAGFLRTNFFCHSGVRRELHTD